MTAGAVVSLAPKKRLCLNVRRKRLLASPLGKKSCDINERLNPNVRVRDIVGRGQVKHTDFAMASGELSRSDFVGFFKSTLAQAAAVSRGGAVHYVCMDWRHVGELIEAGGMIYGEMLNLAVWVKSNAGQGSFYRSQHELIGIFRVGQDAHLNNIELGRHGRSRSNVWHYAGINTFRAGPAGRAAVASDGQAGRAGCGCDEGLQPSRRHRARPLRWVRHDPPGSGARRTRLPTLLHFC
jgi:hypothetical protein